MQVAAVLPRGSGIPMGPHMFESERAHPVFVTCQDGGRGQKELVRVCIAYLGMRLHLRCNARHHLKVFHEFLAAHIIACIMLLHNVHGTLIQQPISGSWPSLVFTRVLLPG